LAGSLAGRLAALNSLGSILGTLGTSFLLIPSFGIRAILFGLAAGTVVLALMGWLAAWMSARACYSEAAR
jgi:hypothetical protein